MGFGAGGGGLIPGWMQGKKPETAKPSMKTVRLGSAPCPHVTSHDESVGVVSGSVVVRGFLSCQRVILAPASLLRCVDVRLKAYKLVGFASGCSLCAHTVPGSQETAHVPQT